MEWGIARKHQLGAPLVSLGVVLLLMLGMCHPERVQKVESSSSRLPRNKSGVPSRGLKSAVPGNGNLHGFSPEAAGSRPKYACGSHWDMNYDDKKLDAFQIAKQDKMAPSVILVSTFLDENIGSVARSMLNFGMYDLRLVTPKCDHLTEKARARAAGAVEILEKARTFDSLEEACSDLNLIMATTARKRGLSGSSGGSRPWFSGHESAKKAAAAALNGERTGLLFGPETSGLTTEDIKFADALLFIPTMPAFRALNLAHAVTVVSYEMYAARQAVLESGQSKVELEDPNPYAGPATRDDVERLLEQVEKKITGSKRFKEPNSAIAMIRAMIGRMSNPKITVREIRMMYGVLQAIEEKASEKE